MNWQLLIIIWCDYFVIKVFITYLILKWIKSFFNTHPKALSKLIRGQERKKRGITRRKFSGCDWQQIHAHKVGGVRFYTSNPISFHLFLSDSFFTVCCTAVSEKAEEEKKIFFFLTDFKISLFIYVITFGSLVKREK